MLSRSIGALRRRIKAALGLRSVLFFQTPPGKTPRFEGKLMEVDAARAEVWAGSVANFPWSGKVARGRIDDKTKLFALMVGDRPVCLGWVSTVATFRLSELGGECRFDPVVHMIWDCLTLPNERRKGYFSDFLTGLRKEFPDKVLTIFCHSEHVASAGAIRNAGFQTWATVKASRLGARVVRTDPASGQIYVAV